MDNHNNVQNSSSSKQTSQGMEPGLLIHSRFQIIRKIGGGSFGEIFIASDLHRGCDVAVKCEPRASKHPQVMYEAKIYRVLAGGKGFPTLHWYGSEGPFNILVLDLLGPSLEEIFTHYRRRLPLKWVLMLADQMIDRLEYLHKRNFLHRDIKPDNFCFGIPASGQASRNNNSDGNTITHTLALQHSVNNNNSSGLGSLATNSSTIQYTSSSGSSSNNPDLIYLLDFGLAKKYRDPRSHQHIPLKTGKSLTGTARYVSISTHLGIEPSRRDDLESLLYVWIYFLRGSLPWQGQKAPPHQSGGQSKKTKYSKIMSLKMETAIDELIGTGHVSGTNTIASANPVNVNHNLNHHHNSSDGPGSQYNSGLGTGVVGGLISVMQQNGIIHGMSEGGPNGTAQPNNNNLATSGAAANGINGNTNNPQLGNGSISGPKAIQAGQDASSLLQHVIPGNQGVNAGVVEVIPIKGMNTSGVLNGVNGPNSGSGGNGGGSGGNVVMVSSCSSVIGGVGGISTSGMSREQLANINDVAENYWIVTQQHFSNPLPVEFKYYLQYCRSLRFEDSPDYGYLRGLIKDVYVRENYQFDRLFDWNTLPSKFQYGRDNHGNGKEGNNHKDQNGGGHGHGHTNNNAGGHVGVLSTLGPNRASDVLNNNNFNSSMANNHNNTLNGGGLSGNNHHVSSSGNNYNHGHHGTHAHGPSTLNSNNLNQIHSSHNNHYSSSGQHVNSAALGGHSSRHGTGHGHGGHGHGHGSHNNINSSGQFRNSLNNKHQSSGPGDDGHHGVRHGSHGKEVHGGHSYSRGDRVRG